MFLKNKYTKTYWKLINSRKLLNRVFDNKIHQKHHIIPKSLGGNDSGDNIIILTFKEHYICHLLLVEMVKGINKSKMIYGFFRFHSEKYTSAKSFDLFMKSFSMDLNGKNNPFYGKKHSYETKRKISENHGMKGKSCYTIWLEKHGKKIADSKYIEMLNKRSKNLSGEKHPFYGKKHSIETINKMKESHKGQTSPMKDRKHSEETKKKLSDIKIGQTSPMKGRKHSEETRKKISNKLKGRKDYFHGENTIWINNGINK